MSRLMVVVVFAAASGCANAHSVFISNETDMWVQQIDHRTGNGELYYCRGNRDQKGEAAPLCFKAKEVDEYRSR